MIDVDWHVLRMARAPGWAVSGRAVAETTAAAVQAVAVSRVVTQALPAGKLLADQGVCVMMPPLRRWRRQ